MTLLRHGCLVLTTIAACALSVPAQTAKVIPASAATTEGSRMSVYPFGYTTPRMQQVWAGTAITSAIALIDGMDYRGNAPRSVAMAGRSIANIQIDFGTTSVTPASMSTTFASNITSAMTRVFNSAYNLPAQAVTPTSPSPFDVKFSWKAPVVFDPSKGNLLTDVTIPGPPGKSQYFIDAEIGGGSGGGSMSPFGAGGKFSTPQSVKLKAVTSSLVPGGTLDLQCSPFTKNYAGNLMVSLSNTMWGAIPLPLDLSLIGAPGNNLYVGMDVVLPFSTAPIGSMYGSNLSAPIPNQGPFYGLKFYTQAYYLDAPANAAGLVTTHGLGLQIASSTGPVTNTIGNFDNKAATGRPGHGNSLGGPVVQFRGVLP